MVDTSDAYTLAIELASAMISDDRDAFGKSLLTLTGGRPKFEASDQKAIVGLIVAQAELLRDVSGVWAAMVSLDNVEHWRNLTAAIAQTRRDSSE